MNKPQTATAEGLILHSLHFRDYDQILTVFSKEEGLLKLIVKGGLRRSTKRASPPLTPLVQAEFIYQKRAGRDLLKCQEVSLIHSHLSLRNNLATLESACDMLKALHLSQASNNPAPPLYQLLILYLNKLPKATHPHNLAASFFLKLLKYEGLLTETTLPPLKAQEKQSLSHLLHAKQTRSLEENPLSSEAYAHVKRWFQERLEWQS